MRKSTGELHIIDFKSQKVVDVIQAKDYLTDKRAWQVQNCVDMLDVTFLEGTKYAPVLQQQNIILKQANSGQVIPYVITEVERDSQAKTLTVYAQGEWTLLDKDSYFRPQELKNMTAKQLLEFALKDTSYKVGNVEVTGTRSTKIDTFMSPLQLLNQIRGLFEKSELNYRVTIAGAGIHTRYVDLLIRKGRDTSKEITIGKDLQGVNRVENSEGIVTALIPFVQGQDQDGKDVITTIESVNSGSIYLVDEEAFQRWNINGKHRYGFYTPETDDNNMTPARLLQLAKTELKKRVNSNVAYEVDVADISQLEGFAHEKVYEGDTIRIIDDGFNPPLYLEARAIGGEESHKDNRTGKYTFGNYREIVDPNDALRKLYQKMLSAIHDKVPADLFKELENKVSNQDKAIEDAKNKLDQAEKETQAVKDLAEKTAEYVENNTANVYEQPTAPTTGLKDGKTIWIDNSNPNERVQKLWKNGQWVRITPDTQPLKDSIAKAQQDLTKAQQDLTKAKQDIVTAQQDLTKTKEDVATTKTDLATTKTDLTNAKSQLQGDITKANQEITGLKTSVGDKVDASWVNKQIEGKADKSGVYDRDYIDNNTVGKQVYETDKQGNVKKFTDMNTAIERNATAISSKAEQSSVNTLSDNLTGVTKRVASVEQTATGLTTRITSAEGKLNTATGDITNLKTKTNTIEQTVDENSQKITSIESRKIGSQNINLGAQTAVLPPRNTGQSTDNSNYYRVNADMKLGREYTISARVKFTTEPPLVSDVISIYPYPKGANVNVTIKDGYIYHTFKKLDAETNSVLLYAGKSGATKGIGAEFTEIMLSEGSVPIAYTPPSPSLQEYTEKTNEIKNTVDGQSQSIKSVTDKANNLEKKTNTIESTVNTNKQAITSVTDKAGVLEKKTSTIEQNVSSISQSLTSVTEKAGTLEKKTATIEQNVNSISQSLTSVTDKAGALESKTNTIETTVNGHTQSISSITGKADTLEKKTNTIESTVNGHTQSIKSVTDRTGTLEGKTGSLETKTNTIEKTVDTNKQSIESVTKKANTLESKTNTLQQTMDSTVSKIETISTTQGKHGELIAQQGSSITQLNNQIGTKVTEKQVQDYIGGLGGTNLAMNSAFEKREIHPTTGIVTKRTPSLDKWLVSGAGTNKTVVVDTARNHEGYSAAKISSSGYDASQFVGISQRVPVVKNSGDYTYSAWFYVADKSLLQGQGAVIKLQFFNGGTGLAYSQQTELEPLLVNNSWVKASVTIPAPNVDITEVRADIWVRRNGILWVAQPMIQQGSSPSTFMENPKDIANYDELIGEVAKKVATSEFNSKVTTMETSINQNTKAISLRAIKDEVYTKQEANGAFGSKAIVERHEAEIKTQADEINLRVKKGDVASTINQTAQSVLIQANKIYLDGYIEAKHLKAQTLQGVTIQTAPSGSGNNQIRLNAQNMTIYGSGRNRGYLGFVNRTDGNITSALILGNDYTSAESLDGSLVVEQTTISGTQWTNSVASIGIASGKNGNDILKKSYINFYRYTGDMDIRSEGSMELLTTNGSIEIDASSSGATTGFLTLKASKDIDMFAKRGQYRFFTSDNLSMPAMTLVDRKPTSSGDVDLTIANLIMLRMARDISYVGDGIQIKSAMGDAFRDMKLRTLRATENISSVGRMWAQEFIPTSSRKLKTDIEDLSFSALDKINSVNIKQYHFIRDVERFESGESITLPINYGMIAEDSDDVFTTPQKDAVTLYSSVAISIQAIQEVDFKVKNLHFDHGMLKQEVEILKEQLETEKLEKIDLAKRVKQLEALVQQILNK